LQTSERSDADVLYEFENICWWAKNNKLMLSQAKTKETVFCRPNTRNLNPPSPLLGIERFTHLKLLGIIIADDFSCSWHVNYVVQILALL
jgi:hypothetical protein